MFKRVKALATFIPAAAFLVLAPLAVEAQQAQKVPRIGLLRATTPTNAAPNNNAFLQGLRDLGYAEGKNVLIEYRYAMGNTDQLRELAAALVSLKVDVIVTGGSSAISAVMKATRTIPIVAGYSGDLVDIGLVDSLAYPGGNVTGMTDVAVDLAAKRLQLFMEIVPKPSQVAMLWPSNSTGAVWAKARATETAARRLGIKLQSVGVQNSSEFQGAYAAMIRHQANGVLIIQSPFTNAHVMKLLELANNSRLPSMCETARGTIKGCLVSYGPDQLYMYQRAATFVDKILKGAKPAEIPIERPTKFELVVNLKTAKALGFTFPPSILLRADKVIE